MGISNAYQLILTNIKDWLELSFRIIITFLIKF